ARTSLRPSPVMVLTPLLGEAGTTSWPPWRRMGTVFEPIRPVPPMTTIFMLYPPLPKPPAERRAGFAARERARDRAWRSNPDNPPGGCLSGTHLQHKDDTS